MLIQLSLVLAASFIFYIIYINGEKSINRIFSQICIISITNTTKFQICPSFLVKNNLNVWKNEILQNKITHYTHDKRSSNSLNRLQPGDMIKDTNNTSPISSSISDVYLLLISVSLINFFICLVIPLLLIKSNKQSKKVFKEGTSSSSSDNADELNEYNVNESTSLNKVEHKTEKTPDDEFAGFIIPKFNSLVGKCYI